MRTEIVVDVGGTLTLEPTRHGQHTARTIAISKPGGTSHVASTAATLDQSSPQKLNAAAAADDTTVTLVAVTGYETRRTYWIENTSTGQREQVYVTKINTSTKVLSLAEPLAFAYTTADYVYSNRITYALSAANSATRDRGYIAVWTYTIGAVVYTERTKFDVVRQKWPEVLLTPARFRELVGPDLTRDIMEAPDRDGFDFADEIATATERLRTMLHRRDLEVDLFVTYEEFQRPIAELVILAWAERGYAPARGFEGESFYDHQTALFSSALDEALDTVDTYDADDSGGVAEVEQDAKPGPVRFWL